MLWYEISMLCTNISMLCYAMAYFVKDMLDRMYSVILEKNNTKVKPELFEYTPNIQRY